MTLPLPALIESLEAELARVRRQRDEAVSALRLIASAHNLFAQYADSEQKLYDVCSIARNTLSSIGAAP